MKNKLIIVLIVLVIFDLSLNIFNILKNTSSNNKIKYVRSPDLIYGYLGTKEVQNIYNDKQLYQEARIDSLKSEYNDLVNKTESVYSSLSQEEKKKKKILLNRKKEEIDRFSMAVNDKMEKEEKRLMQGVLNQINAFVQEYGKENNIDIILGSTTDGNILYGKNSTDITNEILTTLNKNYRPE